jgi:hypothetical protein
MCLQPRLRVQYSYPTMHLPCWITGQTLPSSCVCKSGFVATPNGCACPAGFLFGGSGCYPCSVNTYSPAPSLNSSCQVCDTYKITNGMIGSNSSSLCVCNQQFGFVDILGTCLCPAGSFFNGLQCISCPLNTYQDTPNLLSSCSFCSDIDWYKITNGLTGRTSASACIRPVSFVDDGQDGCACSAGFYLPLTGGSSSCTSCPIGSFTDSLNVNSSCYLCKNITLRTYTVTLPANTSNIFTYTATGSSNSVFDCT